MTAVAPYRKVDEEPSDKVIGVAPAIILVNPRFAYNVAMVVRLASAWGLRQVWFTGPRVGFDVEGLGRLPREERMRGYREVEILHSDRPFDRFPRGVTPVAVEVKADVEMLCDFEHPENAVYVFGPEDGSIPSVMLRHCHRHLVIPARHCLNLATAATAVLWDRVQKRALAGDMAARVTPGEWEGRMGRDPVADRVDEWLVEESR